MKKSLCVLALCLCLATPAFAAPPPKIVNAADGIFAAFQDHPLVGIGDDHNLAQQLDFYGALIRDPRFAQQIGNVVVEFGGAAHQDIMDRYAAGDPVPYTELRKVWTDVVGWSPTAIGLGYLNFYAQVRATNLTLPSDKRIHVWLGEPEIDWSKIKTIADWQRIAGFRNPHAAQIIEKNILDQHKKALVIYGTQHFGPDAETMAQMQGEKAALDRKLGFDTPLGLGLQTLVEQKYPHAFFVVTPYGGFEEGASCAKDFEQNKEAWPVPAFAAPVRGSTLETELQKPGCYVASPASISPPMGGNEADRLKLAANINALNAGLTSDALLYLGPAKTLTRTPMNPDLYLDQDYRDEMSRHSQILRGQPLGPPLSTDMSTGPRPWEP